MLALPTCRWRGGQTEPGRHDCASPKLVVGPGGVADAGCASCYCRDHEGTPPARAPVGPCVHLGAATGETVPCPVCPNGPDQGAKRVPLLACAVHGTTTGKRGAPGRKSCHGCKEYAPEAPRYEVVDNGRLPPGQCFNPSVIVYQGRRLLAYRKEWTNARVHLAELDDRWQPVKQFKPDWHAGGHTAFEDPRLFTFRDRLHLSCTAYNGRDTSVCVVRFRDDLTVEDAWIPRLTPRNPWEKNWAFFETEDGLHAIYHPAPHVVLRMNGRHAERAHETPNPIRWAWGEMRGGAAPVRVGDEFYHFFHSREPRQWGIYHLGLYAFEAKPPFRITRAVRRPLASGTLADRMADDGRPCVVYPGGAVADGADWRIACGFMDTSCRYYLYDRGRLERELVAV